MEKEHKTTEMNIERQKYQLHKKGYENITKAISELKETEPVVQKVQLLGAEIITIKGDKGDKPSTEELKEIIDPLIPTEDDLIKIVKPLIPAPIKGEDGKDGVNGKDGKDGTNGTNGKDGVNGTNGKDGVNGKDGSPDTPDEIVKKLQGVKKKWLSIEAIDGDFNAKVKRIAQVAGGGSAGVKSVSAGTNITVDNTDPANPIISSTGGGGASYTFQNGLTEAAGVVELGGTINPSSVLTLSSGSSIEFNTGTNTLFSLIESTNEIQSNAQNQTWNGDTIGFTADTLLTINTPNIGTALTGDVLTLQAGGEAEWQTPTGPLTTKGDLYIYDTENARLGVGADGQVLVADSTEATGLKWINSSGIVNTLANTSADSTTTASSLYQMTPGVNVDFQTSGAVSRLKLFESGGVEISSADTIISGFTNGLNVKGADPTFRITDNVGNGKGVFISGDIQYNVYTNNNWAGITNAGTQRYNRWGFGGNFAINSIVHARTELASDIVGIFQGTTSQTGSLIETRLVNDVPTTKFITTGTKFLNSAYTGSTQGGIFIENGSPDVAGQSTVYIKGTNATHWAGTKGITFQNHTEAIDVYSPTTFNANVGFAGTAWLGNTIGNASETLWIGTPGTGVVNQIALKYATSGYPVTNYASVAHNFYAKTGATWPDGSGVAVYGTKVLEIIQTGVNITGFLNVDGVVRLKGYTVATLPTGTQGDTAFVTDCVTVPAKGVAPTGGGSAVGVVFYDGSAWVGI